MSEYLRYYTNKDASKTGCISGCFILHALAHQLTSPTFFTGENFVKSLKLYVTQNQTFLP